MSMSLIGILIGLAVLITLAMRGWHIILLAPLAASIVCIFSDMNILTSLTGPYMDGFIAYAQKYYLIFLGASLFAKYMDDSGAAKRIAFFILSKVDKEKPFHMLLSIWLITSVLTYGGVNLWVVAFVLIPITLPIFKEMNIAWHLCLAPFMLGLGTATMTMLPGTPAIQNIMPTKVLGTAATAAPLIGIVSSIIVTILGFYYIRYALKQSLKKNETFIKPLNISLGNDRTDNLPSLIASILPPITLIVVLNVFKLSIEYTLFGSTFLCMVLFHRQIHNHMDTLNKGALNSVMPVINTCADVGFGRVVAATSGFQVALSGLLNIPGNPIIAMSVAVNLLAGLTGSGSGGLGIALDTIIPKFVELGINPEVIHRIASMSCGGLDTLPHNGAVITILAVFGLMHKEGYKHMFYTCLVGPVITLVPAIAMAIYLY